MGLVDGEYKGPWGLGFCKFCLLSTKRASGAVQTPLLWHPLMTSPFWLPSHVLCFWLLLCGHLHLCTSFKGKKPPSFPLAPALPIPSMASWQPLPVLVILNINVFQILISIPKPCPEVLPIKEPPFQLEKCFKLYSYTPRIPNPLSFSSAWKVRASSSHFLKWETWRLSHILPPHLVSKSFAASP